MFKILKQNFISIPVIDIMRHHYRSQKIAFLTRNTNCSRKNVTIRNLYEKSDKQIFNRNEMYFLFYTYKKYILHKTVTFFQLYQNRFVYYIDSKLKISQNSLDRIWYSFLTEYYCDNFFFNFVFYITAFTTILIHTLKQLQKSNVVVFVFVNHFFLYS